MAKQANSIMIGGFVVIAVFLLAVSVVIFGSGRFFKQTEKFVLHFDGSINGLNIGAPVFFQGVQIGSVTNIVLRTNREELTVDIPVIIEIEPDRFQVVDATDQPRDIRETLSKLIEKGLRAVLTTQSFITGQLMIELGYYPVSTVNLENDDHEYPEIPTIPSTTTRLYHTLQNINVEQIAQHFEKTMTGIDSLVNNPDLSDVIKSLKVAADELREVIGKFDANVDPILHDFKGTLDDSRMLINRIESQVEPLSGEMQKTLQDYRSLARNAGADLKKISKQLDKAMTGVSGVLSDDAPLIIQLEETLQDMSAMTRSVRQLAEYLEQHPEALIRGKSDQGR